MSIRSNNLGLYGQLNGVNPLVFKGFLLLAHSQASRSLVIKLVTEPRMGAPTVVL